MAPTRRHYFLLLAIGSLVGYLAACSQSDPQGDAKAAQEQPPDNSWIPFSLHMLIPGENTEVSALLVRIRFMQLAAIQYLITKLLLVAVSQPLNEPLDGVLLLRSRDDPMAQIDDHLF